MLLLLDHSYLAPPQVGVANQNKKSILGGLALCLFSTDWVLSSNKQRNTFENVWIMFMDFKGERRWQFSVLMYRWDIMICLPASTGRRSQTPTNVLDYLHLMLGGN